jgi:Fe-S oxidoreductase
MFIAETKDVIWNCRFCLMCRHVCTSARFTKSESDTPRAKALNLWTVLEGMRQFEASDAEVFFRCADCSRCRAHCISDYDVPGMVEAARRDLVSAGLVPEVVRQLRQDVLDAGNPFGLSASVGKASGSYETLIFPGCELSCHAGEIGDRALLVMERLGRKAGVLRDGCCGAPLRSLGFHEDARLVAERLAAKIRASSASEVVVLCPTCLIAFRQGWVPLPEGVRVAFHLELVAEAMAAERLRPARGPRRKLLIHDPCSTGRRLAMYELPRTVLSSLPDIEVGEFFLSKGESLCCGGSAASRRISPEMARHSASLILDEAREAGADGIVTTCPSCRVHFNQQDRGIRTYDPLELLLE